MKLIAIAFAAAAIAAPALAQTTGEHDPSHGAQAPATAAKPQGEPAGHDMESMHDGHDMPGSAQPSSDPGGAHDAHTGHATPAASDGPWSYKGRQNPEPHTKGRWETVPHPDQMQFVSADELSAKERCQALLSNAHVVVDRATKAACGKPEMAAPASTADHSGHAGH